MKKFTNVWRLMMILLLSSSMLLLQAQKNMSAERAPVKNQISAEQLKILNETGFTTDQLLILEKQGIDLELLKDKDYLIKAEELLGMTSKDNNKQEENPGSPSDPVSVYTFDQTSGTFTPIAGGTILGTATSDDQYFVDPAVPTGGTTKTGPGFPIGFNFNYNGYTFDVFGINNNGWMGLGQSSLTPSVDMNSTSGYTPLSSVAVNTPDYLRSRVAVMGRDIQAQAGAELRIETIGTEPDRILVVQWIGYKKYGTSGTGDNFSFQIRLYETTNVIELVYGAVTSNATSTTVQVGLGGSIPSDFFNRTTTTDWTATIPGLTNADACTLSDVVFPPDGLTFIFNPPPAGSPGSPFNPNPVNGALAVPISTNLTWDFGSLTETYDLYFDIVNPPVTKVVDNETAGATGLYDPPNDLNYSIPYFWQVIARNSSKLETAGPVWSFSTECGAISTYPWTEGFEAVTIPALPACWLKENGDWITTNNANSTYDADAYTGTQFLRESWNATNEYIWTPNFALDAGTPYDFSFWWAGDNYAGWTGDVFYNTSQNSAGATQLGTSFVEAGTTTTKIYEQVINTFVPATSGTYYFAIRVNCPSSSPWYLSFDDFRFEPSPDCPMPGNLGAANIFPTTADLTWNSFSGLSDIEFGLEGFTPTGIPTQAGITSPYTMGGLTAQTAYSFYVRDDCGSGSYSSWAGPETFTTACDLFVAPFLEEYTTWPPLCWDLTGGTYSWVQYTTGVECARANFWGQTSGNTDIMTTPLIDVTGGNFGLEFYWSHLFSTTYPLDALEVLVSDDNGANWTQVWYKVGADFNSNDGAGNTTPGTFVSSDIIPLSQFGSPIMVRFFGHSGYGPDCFIDNVNVFEVAYGDLTGTVTKLSNSTPVEGAEINLGSLSTTTGSDGTYSIPGILVGNYLVTCNAAGYNPESANVTILENQLTTQDFSLTAPQMVVNPLTITVEVEPNAQADETANISNPGNGPLDWDASIVLLNEQTKDPWDLQFSFDVTAASGAAGNAGAECDGEFYYTTRWASSLIHKYDLGGNLIEEFSIPGVTGLRDLAYDGTYFYGGAAANTIYQMDFTNHTLISTIASPQPVRSIAYDEGQNGLWVANWATDIVLINMSGVTLSTIPASTHGLLGIYGTAYDNWSAGGPYLWIFDQGAGAGAPQIIHQADLTSITMTGFTHDVTADLPPNASAIAGGLFTAPNVFPGSVSLGGLIQGTPDMFFVYELAPFSTWLIIAPNSGTLIAGTNEDMNLHFDATEMLPGVYQAEIHFSTDPNVGSPVINVTMTVVGLIPATNLSATFSCTDVELTWEMPTGGNPDSWNVYRDGGLLGNSTNMDYTDPLVMPQVEYSYYVTAVYAGEESMPSAPATITVPLPGSLQPIGLSASANTPTYYYVTLDWNEPNACLEPDGYHIYRDNVQITTDSVTGLTYVDGPLSSGLYEYKLKAVYYFGESGFSTPVVAFIPVGIEETDDGLFRIFPNPASQMVTIESTMEITGIKVFNNSGQVVMDEIVNVMSYQIDVSQFEKGIYYIRLETNEGKLLRKITVN